MNKKINLEGITLRYLYDRNKLYLLPILVIFASLVLFLKVTLPLFSEYGNLKNLRNAEEKKLSVLKNNYKVLSNLDGGILDSQLAVVTDALPAGKDFASILTAVSISADKAGVLLGDYEFQVGDLSKYTPSVRYPSLELVLTVNGGVKSILNFMDEIQSSVPVSEIINVEMNNNRSVITVLFYYKVFPGTLPVTSPIQTLSQKNISTINTIFSWNNARLTGEFIPQSATSSAIPPF